MATAETIICKSDTRNLPEISRSRAMIATVVLTALSVAIQGYHPYAEDGGLYLSEVKKVLDPGLYPGWSQFVTAQAKFSLFAPIMAEMVRISHLDLMIVTFLVYLGSIWATLLAAWMIALRCFRNLLACYSATSLMALWLTMPIAGTSLMLMDPYVTARSLSTPFALLALAFTIDICEALRIGITFPWRRLGMAFGFMVMAEIMHPLMATYTLSCILLFASAFATRGKWRVIALCGLCGLGYVVAAALYFSTPLPTSEYLRVAQTRSYWFIDQWQWYELFGLAAPLLLLAVIPRLARKGDRPPLKPLVHAALAAGAAGVIIAAYFARETSAVYSVARLQPLRIFQTVYILMIVLLGGVLAERVMLKRIERWVALFAIAGGIALTCELQSYPSSAHLEVPWNSPHNKWEQAFQWVRQNTPRDALFAMDSNYITKEGEDSQNFRAIAERSTLPDYSKDGGIAAIAPQLADRWAYGERVEAHLDELADTERESRLLRSGAEWVVLSGRAETGFYCPYANGAVKICEIPNLDDRGE